MFKTFLFFLFRQVPNFLQCFLFYFYFATHVQMHIGTEKGDFLKILLKLNIDPMVLPVCFQIINKDVRNKSEIMLLSVQYAGNGLQQIIKINNEQKVAFSDLIHILLIHFKVNVKNRLNSTALRFISLLFLYTYVNKTIT